MPPQKSSAPLKSSSPEKLGFFRTLKSALYSPMFYASIEQQSPGKAFGYFVLLTAMYSVLLMGSLWLAIGNKIDLSPQALTDKLASIYPEELVVTFQNGQAGVNVEEPYFIDMPEEWNEVLEATDSSHLAVLDTQTEFSIPQFKDYNALFWLSGDSLYYADDQNGDISGTSLKQVPNTEWDKAKVNELTAKVGIALKKFMPILVAGVLVAIFVALLAWHALYLLLLAVFISIIRSLLNLPAGFGLSYKTGLYAITYTYATLLVILSINTISSETFQSFPFMVTLITVAGVGLNLKNVKA